MAEWKRRKKYRIDKDQEEPVVHRGYQITNLLRREFVLTLIFVAISTTALLGGSYAIFTNIQKAEQYNMIKSGTLQIAYDDTSSGLGNIIRLNGAFPESDVVGQEREPYRFKITNTGSLNAEYKVKILDDLSMIEEDGCQNKLLDKSVLKYSIDGGEPVLLSTIQDEYIAVNGNLSAGESITYEIRMWIDESAGNEVLGRHYHGKIVVEGEQMQKNLLGRASDVIFDLENIGDKGAIDTRDEKQTFITGENPNNYVWYSGKLWRAVSKDSSDNSVKLITQWNMTGIRYSTANGNDYSRSMLKEWLNDTSVDGFLGNLREPEKFLVMNSEWNATKTIASNKIPEDTIVIGTVGALNAYEFGRAKTYLNNGLYWWSLSPSKNSSAYTYVISPDGLLSEGNNQDAYGVRPAVNLQPDIKIVAGDGTEENPYRLKNDFDEKQDGVFLNTRYSGEYIQFGAGENSLYRIVSKEFSGVKIVSEEPLKTNGVFMSKRFSTTINTSTYDPTSASFAVAYWLNYDYLNTENGYLTPALVRMIENSTWYLGVVKRSDSNLANYKLAKYTNISGTTLVDSKVEARVGLLRFGEQFTGQSHSDSENTVYYLITPESNSFINLMTQQGIAQSTRAITNQYGVRPSLHLKSSVKITGGEGTKQNPFTIGQ